MNQLGAYAAQRYAADVAKGAADYNEWLDLAIILGPYVPSSARPAMAKGFKDSLCLPPTPSIRRNRSRR